MLADLHAHYPMQVINDLDPETTARLMKRRVPTIRDRVQALVLRIANRLSNLPQLRRDLPRHAPRACETGGVGLAMSVLLGPVRRDGPRQALRRAAGTRLLRRLIADIEAVEPRSRPTIAR